MYSLTIIDRATPAVLAFEKRLNAKALQDAVGGRPGWTPGRSVAACT